MNEAAPRGGVIKLPISATSLLYGSIDGFLGSSITPKDRNCLDSRCSWNECYERCELTDHEVAGYAVQIRGEIHSARLNNAIRSRHRFKGDKPEFVEVASHHDAAVAAQ